MAAGEPAAGTESGGMPVTGGDIPEIGGISAPGGMPSPEPQLRRRPAVLPWAVKHQLGRCRHGFGRLIIEQRRLSCQLGWSSIGLGPVGAGSPTFLLFGLRRRER